MLVDTEDSGEVISINGEASGNDEPLTGKEDRGDIVDTDVSEDPPQQAAKEAPADAPEDDAKPKVIPKARFDEVNEARKSAQAALDAANAEIAALKAAPAPKAEPIQDSFDEDAKEGEYIEAMLEGDTAKAKEIGKEINTNLRNQAAQQVQASMKQAEVASTMQAESTKALEDYPYLDTPDGELALSLIVAARNADIAKGVPAHLALRKAVAAIAPKFMPEDDTPSRELPQSKPQSDTRTQEALKRGANDSLRQPPQVQAGIGNRTTQARVDVENLDDDQFANLSAAEKKRLRGD